MNKQVGIKVRQEFWDYLKTKVGIDEQVLRGRSRLKSVARARAIACYALRKSGFSLTEISRVFDRDHTTIMCALRRAKIVRRTEFRDTAMFDELVTKLASKAWLVEDELPKDTFVEVSEPVSSPKVAILTPLRKYLPFEKCQVVEDHKRGMTTHEIVSYWPHCTKITLKDVEWILSEWNPASTTTHRDIPR